MPKNELSIKSKNKIRTRIKSAFLTEDKTGFDKWYSLALKNKSDYKLTSLISDGINLLIKDIIHFNKEFFEYILVKTGTVGIKDFIQLSITYNNEESYKILQKISPDFYNSFNKDTFKKFLVHSFSYDFDYALKFSRVEELKEQLSYYTDSTEFSMINKVFNFLSPEKKTEALLSSLCLATQRNHVAFIDYAFNILCNNQSPDLIRKNVLPILKTKGFSSFLINTLNHGTLHLENLLARYELKEKLEENLMPAQTSKKLKI